MSTQSQSIEEAIKGLNLKKNELLLQAQKLQAEITIIESATKTLLVYCGDGKRNVSTAASIVRGLFEDHPNKLFSACEFTNYLDAMKRDGRLVSKMKYTCSITSSALQVLLKNGTIKRIGKNYKKA